MNEQVSKSFEATFLVPAVMGGKAIQSGRVVHEADYDALRAEAESLRAENGRLSQQLAQSDSALRESRANDMANVRTLENMWERHDALRQELEAARGLLRDIYMTCNLREMPSEHAIRDISNQIEALLTATPAPEVPDHLRDSAKMVEQGERQEAQQKPVGHVFTMQPCFPGEPMRAHAQLHVALPAGTKLYAEPQPGPDVRGLVEALDDACEEFELRGLHGLKAYKNLKQHHADLAHRQAQRKGESHDN